MLVLSRQKDEKIVIGDDIVITIVDIRGDKVKIGITAPLNIPVYRHEVYMAIKEANIEAAKSASEGLPDLNKVKEMLGKPLRRQKETNSARTNNTPR